MSNLYLIGGTFSCLLGITGIVVGSVGLSNIPTSLTREEMYNTATGAACSPEVCSQMLSEKQRASEGVRFSIAGVFLFVCNLVCTIAGFLYINYCSDRPWRRVRPTELETSSEATLVGSVGITPVIVSEATLVGSVGITPVIVSGQTVPQPTHSPSTTRVPQQTSSSSGPQELPPP